MPTDPNYEYVDRVHKKTEHLASEGWRYGCHSQHMGSGPPESLLREQITHQMRIAVQQKLDE